MTLDMGAYDLWTFRPIDVSSHGRFVPEMIRPTDVLTPSLLIRQCLHVRNPTAKIEYFPSGTRRLIIVNSHREPDGKKIYISRQEADWLLLTYHTQTPVLLSGPAQIISGCHFVVISLLHPTPALGK